MPSPACRSSMLVTIVALLAATLTGARSLANPPSEIAKKVMPSVVLVTTEDDQGEALARGSGFVVAEGVIATNLHVIRSASKAFVKVVNSEIQLEVLGIVAENNEWDLVLLAVKDLTAPPLPLGESAALQVGDDVYAVGNPHGLEGTFSAGIVSSIRRLEGDALLQITAPISPGSSGGPIVNKDAEVVGVAVASLMEGQNLNFAISSKQLNGLLSQRAHPVPLAHGFEKPSKPDFTEQKAGIDWTGIAAKLKTRAEQGDADAMSSLGVMYASGLGVTEDDVEAVRWYRTAADLGNAEAMYNLALMYANGEGVEENDLEAVKWYHIAADMGYTHAMFNLAWMYAHGQGVDVANDDAVKWYRQAADKGHTKAMYNLAVMYLEIDGLAQVNSEAVKWLRKSAELGEPKAMALLGLMYANGEGVTEDAREGMKWSRKAAELGIADAMFQVGSMYSQGRGVLKDDREAMKWYRKAAELGVSEAMNNLAVMYVLGDEKFLYGEGRAPDLTEAYTWFSLAAAFGYKKAVEQRDDIARALTSEERMKADSRTKEYFERIERASKK